MFTLLKVLFVLAIVVPLALLALLLGGVMVAVVFGIAGAIIGIAFFLVKVALFLVLPVLAIVWLVSKLFGHRSYSHQSEIDVNEWA
jgi:membrane protein implicated in regulation of membrane protease activity